MCRVNNQIEGKPLTAEQVQSLLREKAHQQYKDVSRAFCALDKSGRGLVTRKAQKELLKDMMLMMSKEEFENLWNMYDPQGTGSISFQDFLQKIGIS